MKQVKGRRATLMVNRGTPTVAIGVLALVITFFLFFASIWLDSEKLATTGVLFLFTGVVLSFVGGVLNIDSYKDTRIPLPWRESPEDY